MISIEFIGSNNSVQHGIVIGRMGHMFEVAWDIHGELPARISWVNPMNGNFKVNSVPFQPIHKALREIFAGNVELARAILTEEERNRQKERLAKESTTALR